ncbi:MAG: hypothetical protein ACJ77K_18885 [Bacteroidia bacterium]
MSKKETLKKTKRTCKKGHAYYKSTDCPTCPKCEEAKRPKEGFLSLLGAPARRAMENSGILTLEQLSTYSEKEVLSFHGIGKTSIPILKTALTKAKLKFRQ